EPVTTSARRVETRWRRPPITHQAWLENQRLSLGTPTGNQPIRVSASELGGREADVHGSPENRMRGRELRMPPSRGQRTRWTTMNQPIRVSASELGGREADVHGSPENRMRGRELRMPPSRGQRTRWTTMNQPIRVSASEFGGRE